jgi:uncharacterized membrane protein YbhN (UPF0104 family)
MDAEIPAERQTSRLRSLAVLAVKLAISAALLVVLFSRVDLARLWASARGASLPWLTVALGFYAAMILGSAWRWGLLLRAQHVEVPFRALTSSFLVATFFNNFLPSNIGGDVVRIGDTARPAGSKTLATTVVLIDRGIGLLGLVLIAALGATARSGFAGEAVPVGAPVLWAGLGIATILCAPALLMPQGVGRLLQPLAVLHPEWVETRIGRLTGALARFRAKPGALAGCFAGAVFVQAVLVAFYAAVASSMSIPISVSHLAVIVPLSFVVQMLPVSLNGFGVREATFGLYFTRAGLPLESALLVSFVGAALVMIFSLSGAAVYVARRAR